MKSIEERFNSRIIKSDQLEGCWIWTGAIGNDGYGRFWLKDPVNNVQKVVRAHRFAYEMRNGHIEEHQHILHRCDNPLCVKATDDSTTHLILGDHSENMLDRSAKGRSNFQSVYSSADARVRRTKAAHQLRTFTLEHGYSQSAVDQLRKNLAPDQLVLF